MQEFNQIDFDKAIKLQKVLAKKVVVKDKLPEQIETVAGVDISFGKKDQATAAAVVLQYENLKVIENQTTKVKLDFPYIPGLLAFREGKAVLTVLDKVETTPTITLLDGHGIAHPRRVGIATHIGVLLDTPTVGVAKNILVGEVEEEPEKMGEWTPLTDGEETIGAALKTTPHTNPIYVSIGHKISLARAIEVVCKTVKKHRLPEPLRLAHILATATQKGEHVSLAKYRN